MDTPTLKQRMQAVASVERDWLPRIAVATLYRYALPAGPFRSLDDAGMHVSHETVRPHAVTAVSHLRQALRASGTELRPVDALRVLRPVWQSTLHASGIRLRHATGWD